MQKIQRYWKKYSRVNGYLDLMLAKVEQRDAKEETVWHNYLNGLVTSDETVKRLTLLIDSHQSIEEFLTVLYAVHGSKY